LEAAECSIGTTIGYQGLKSGINGIKEDRNQMEDLAKEYHDIKISDPVRDRGQGVEVYTRQSQSEQQYSHIPAGPEVMDHQIESAKTQVREAMRNSGGMGGAVASVDSQSTGQPNAGLPPKPQNMSQQTQR